MMRRRNSRWLAFALLSLLIALGAALFVWCRVEWVGAMYVSPTQPGGGGRFAGVTWVTDEPGDAPSRARAVPTGLSDASTEFDSDAWSAGLPEAVGLQRRISVFGVPIRSGRVHTYRRWRADGEEMQPQIEYLRSDVYSDRLDRQLEECLRQIDQWMGKPAGSRTDALQGRREGRRREPKVEPGEEPGEEPEAEPDATPGD